MCFVIYIEMGRIEKILGEKECIRGPCNAKESRKHQTSGRVIQGKIKTDWNQQGKQKLEV